MTGSVRQDERDRLIRVARRSAPWMVVGALFLLLSIPALFDLHGLLVGLGLICAGFGVVTAAFTWFDRRTG